MRENRKCFLFSSGWDEDKVRCSTNRQGKEFHQQTKKKFPPTDKAKSSTEKAKKVPPSTDKVKFTSNKVKRAKTKTPYETHSYLKK